MPDSPPYPLARRRPVLSPLIHSMLTCLQNSTLMTSSLPGFNEWRIRSGPSPQSPTIAVIEVGARIVVTHVESPWMRVKFENGLTGWTRASQDATRYLFKATTQTPRIAARIYTGWRRGTVAAPAPLQTVLLVDRFESAAASDATSSSTAVISDPKPDAVSIVMVNPPLY